MFVFFDGAAITALTLLTAMALGAYIDAHPNWGLARSETLSVSLIVTFTVLLTVGGVTAWVACAEYGLAVLPWMALYIAIQIAATYAFRTARRLVARRGLAVT